MNRCIYQSIHLGCGVFYLSWLDVSDWDSVFTSPRYYFWARMRLPFIRLLQRYQSPSRLIWQISLHRTLWGYVHGFSYWFNLWIGLYGKFLSAESLRLCIQIWLSKSLFAGSWEVSSINLVISEVLAYDKGAKPKYYISGDNNHLLHLCHCWNKTTRKGRVYKNAMKYKNVTKARPPIS